MHDISLDPSNLKKGVTVLFMVEETDSVISEHVQQRRRSLLKAIHFTVLDTVDGTTIEWNEQHFLERLDSNDVYGPARDWAPYCRLVYQCDKSGAINKVLNYEEVRSTIDPLIEHYLQLTGVAVDPRFKTAMPAMLDSAWVISRLLANAELLHRSYGITLSPCDTTKLSSYTPYTTPEFAEYHIVLQPSALCENNVGIKSWSDPIRVDLNKFLLDRTLVSEERIDTTIPSAISVENMDACFDQQRTIMTYMNFERRMRWDTVEFVQRVLLFEQE